MSVEAATPADIPAIMEVERMPGFEDLELDVHVQPGRTITLHEDLRPRP